MAKTILPANLRRGSVEGSSVAECSTAAMSICYKDTERSRKCRSHGHALLMWHTALKQNLCLSGLIWHWEHSVLRSCSADHTNTVSPLLSGCSFPWQGVIEPGLLCQPQREAAATTMLVRRDFDHGQLCAKLLLLSTPSLPVQDYFYEPDYHPSSCTLDRVA